MRYLPHTDADTARMLEVLGVESLDALFSGVPNACRRHRPLDLSDALTEWELGAHMKALAGEDGASKGVPVSFLGAGRYDHFIPETVKSLLGRSEFFTAYTPYQPEMSQGTLQAIYEYQTLTARLLGMEAANASLYDGASALAEALLLATRVTRKKRVAVSRLIHPHYRQVVDTYLGPTGSEMVLLPYSEKGRTELEPAGNTGDLGAVAIQSPNFLGCMEDLETAARFCEENKTLLIVAFTEPLAYAMFKSPGLQGAHIACGEGQSLGVPKWFGGPGLGMFACKSKYMRNMPGRLVGQTRDLDGERGYVLTLATREQHIRREKATSNICTNSSLCALSAAMYMASLGRTGMRALSRLNHDKAAYLKGALQAAGVRIPYESPFFNEFVADFNSGFSNIHTRLLNKGIIAGLSLERWYPELEAHYLLCATETRTREEMDHLVREVIR